MKNLARRMIDGVLISFEVKLLLQLANCYAVSRSKINNRSDGTQSSSKPLLDRIGLCCVSRNRISCSDEMKMEDKIAAKQKLELTNGAHLAVDAVDFAAKLLQEGGAKRSGCPLIC